MEEKLRRKCQAKSVLDRKIHRGKQSDHLVKSMESVRGFGSGPLQADVLNLCKEWSPYMLSLLLGLLAHLSSSDLTFSLSLCFLLWLTLRVWGRI